MMVLSEEQAEKIKEQLLKQLEKFPEDRREMIKGQVESMTTSQVEDFIEENNLNHFGAKGNCIFCSILEGKAQSFKVAENEDNVAILEINPISRAHTLIVPKKHDSELNPSAREFSQKVAKRISDRFNPKEIQSSEINIMGHQLLEIIPIYGDEKERAPASPEDLKRVQDEIIKPESERGPEKQERKEEEKVVEIQKEVVRAKARIP
jgi:diadenosine tetraphosphate (Ap4A) HIT family hydrolase